MLVKFTYALLHNEENEYCVYQYKDLDTRKKVTCIGYGLPNIQIPYEFEVEEVEHKIYGKQYKVISFEERVGSDKESIIEYLGSGLFRGIGKTTAQRIYDHFKQDTLEIMEHDIAQLIKVKGISSKTLKKIKSSYEENKVSKDVQQYLIPYGFTTKIITKICLNKKITLDDIKKNPYILCDYQGVTFYMVDSMRKTCGIDTKNPRRLEAVLYEALKRSNTTGSVGTTKQKLLQNMQKISMINDIPYLWKFVRYALVQDKISYKRKKQGEIEVLYFYLNYMCKAEESLANEIVRLMMKPCRKYNNLNEIIMECCKESNIILDESQFAAVKNSFLYNLSIITGGPGTGKTTISKIIIMVQEKLKKSSNVELLAPTGRAARRMTECMDKLASTIHSRLQLGIHNDGIESMYREDVENPIECDLCIIDEFSMVDMMLALKLFQSVKQGRVVIVGDKDQLGSVRAGNVLKDMLESKVIPVSVLEYEHRQGDDSMICVNAHNILKGITTLKDGNDFHSDYIAQDSKSLPTNYLQLIEDRIVAQYIKDFKDPTIKSIVCLSPYKEGTAGVYSLNRRIQELINPSNNRDEIKIPNDMVVRTNDIVMQLQNEDEVCNGDIGKITSIVREENKNFTYADFSEVGGPKDYEYSSDNINSMTLAYSMTVHKSQGGEYDSVISCMTKDHKMLLKRNILYTGITRGKKKVTNFFDTPETVAEAIKNDQSENRYTLLKYLLIEMLPALYKEVPKKEEYKQLAFA